MTNTKQEWRERFLSLFPYLQARKKDIIAFITAEKEASYQEGLQQVKIEHCSEPKCPECNQAAYQRGLQEERQFVLNILKGIDIADKQMGLPQDTKTIRLALKSRPLPIKKEEV